MTHAATSSSSLRITIPIVAGIGNALLAIPMVRQIKRQLPLARVTILARIDAMGEVFRRLGGEVDEVIVTGKGAKGLLRMIAASRRRRADVYLVPFPSNRWQYAMLALTSGARRRILHGYPVGYWRAMHFIGERVPAERGLHDVDQNLRLLTGLGLEPVPGEAPVFAVNERDRAQADELLRQAKLEADVRPIVIHAGSARTILAQAKRWPPASYARLIEMIQREWSQRVVLVEGPDEAGVAEEILAARTGEDASSPPALVRLSGSLGVAAALLERAALYVGSDSGLAHLSAAVGTPAVTLFAPADPDRVAPYGYRDLVVQAPVPCAPCFEYPWNATRPRMRCHDPLCITTITPEAVMEKVRRALAAARGSAVAAAAPDRSGSGA